MRSGICILAAFDTDAQIGGNFRPRTEIGKSNFPLFGDFQPAALWYLSNKGPLRWALRTMASSSVICTCGGWKTLGHAAWLGAHIVNFADDLVILCHGTAEKALQTMREMMERLKLTVNENKTHLCKVPDASFDFLGYTFGRCYSPKTG